jgi:hypothetical protein
MLKQHAVPKKRRKEGRPFNELMSKYSEYDELQHERTELNVSLVGKVILQKWKFAGWCMGKVTHFYKNVVKIPGETAKGNYAVKWVDDVGQGVRDCLLRLEEYGRGEDSDTGSWVLLTRRS